MTDTASLPTGVLAVEVQPPRHPHGCAWDAVIGADDVKDRLLGQAMVTLLHGQRLRGTPLAGHGVILLVGPPGTGKSTLARGLAETAARAVATRGSTTVVTVDPHALPSDLLGESQRSVARLLQHTLADIHAERPHTVVLIDEVEAFATSRHAVSFGSNPIDVHRATDAVLAGLDHASRTMPGVLFVATTNFPEAVDGAFVSRADLVVELGLPDDATLRAIVADSLRELAAVWPAITPLADDPALHERVAKLAAGWDGRRVRKAVASALALRPDLAREPGNLSADDVEAAVVAARRHEPGGAPR